MDNYLNIIKTFGIGSSRYISCLPFNFKTNIIKESIINKNINDNLDKNYLLTVPIGNGIVHWNVKTKKRSPLPNVYKQLHSDVITCLIRCKPIPLSIINNITGSDSNQFQWFNNYFHISSSYCGEIGIWDSEWNEVIKYQLPAFKDNDIASTNKIMHISIDESYKEFPYIRLVVSNEHSNCNIIVLKLNFSNYLYHNNNNNNNNNGRVEIEIENEFSNKLYFFGEMIDSNHFLTIQQDFSRGEINKQQQENQQEEIFKIGENILNVLKINCKTGEIIKEIKSLKGSECILLIKNQNYYDNDNDGDQDNKTIALSRGRIIEILNLKDNQLNHVKSIKCEGSGLMRDLLFYQNLLLVPSSNSDLLLYSIDDEKLLSKWKSNHGVVYSLKWSIPGKRLWLFDESGIHSIYLKNQNNSNDESIKLIENNNNNNNMESEELKDNDNYKLLYHQITCCGIDFNSDGNKIACGDFLGNCMIWDINNQDEPIMEYCFDIPIRSLSWGGGDNSLLIGLMDGSLMYWNLLNEINFNDDNDNNLNPILVSSLQDSITCIQWEKGNLENNKKSIVGVGTTGGHLNIFKRTINNKGKEIFNLEWSCFAHQPHSGPQDLKFGSINKFAEIWSLTFHPKNNEIIATCSEDQTTIIWNRVTGEKIQILKGHTTAVTCVDWQTIDNNNVIIGNGIESSSFNILATCADDQTVRIWNTDLWKEILILNTTNIGEWHTVTYLSLIVNENKNPLVVCATQNGWIFVWDSINGNKIYSKRNHLGSIEGLRWNKFSNSLISCSSDCLINLYKLN